MNSSSSGKTTSAKRLCTHLVTKFLRPKMISLDNYFVNRADTPLDENGEYDFENLHTVRPRTLQPRYEGSP